MEGQVGAETNLQLDKRKTTKQTNNPPPTKITMRVFKQGRSPEIQESPSLEFLKIQLDKALKHTVLTRLALNWRFGYMTFL